jgi:hypothetical protein
LYRAVAQRLSLNCLLGYCRHWGAVVGDIKYCFIHKIVILRAQIDDPFDLTIQTAPAGIALLWACATIVTFFFQVGLIGQSRAALFIVTFR